MELCHNLGVDLGRTEVNGQLKRTEATPSPPPLVDTPLYHTSLPSQFGNEGVRYPLPTQLSPLPTTTQPSSLPTATQPSFFSTDPQPSSLPGDLLAPSSSSTASHDDDHVAAPTSTGFHSFTTPAG